MTEYLRLPLCTSTDPDEYGEIYDAENHGIATVWPSGDRWRFVPADHPDRPAAEAKATEIARAIAFRVNAHQKLVDRLLDEIGAVETARILDSVP